MRVMMIGGVLFVTSVITAHADSRWCANYGTGPGMNCGFHSFQQCQATISGNGGFCQQNYGTRAEPRARTRRDN